MKRLIHLAVFISLCILIGSVHGRDVQESDVTDIGSTFSSFSQTEGLGAKEPDARWVHPSGFSCGGAASFTGGNQ